MLKFLERKCRTTTYQKSFLLRSTRLWNTLADELNLNMDNLSSFKSVMLKYYFAALSNYDCDNPVHLKPYVLNATVLVTLFVL